MIVLHIPGQLHQHFEVNQVTPTTKLKFNYNILLLFLASFQLDALLDLISPSTEIKPKQANSEVLFDGPDTRNGLRTLDTTKTASIVAGTRSIKSLTSKLQMQQELYSNDHLMSQNISAMMASQTSDGTTVISSTTSTHMGYQPSLSLADPVYSNKPSKSNNVLY
jgi:hypothetical protein